MTEKQKKSMLIGSLLAVVVLMAIAYSAFASNLTITGTGSVSSNWCIGFDSTKTSDYQATVGITGGTVPTGSMAFSGDSCGSNYKITASLNASFKQPGDKIEYTLTIGNKGTLPAAIESINVDGSSVTSDTTITKGNIKYIIEMPQSTSLAVNATTTMKVIAMFQNDTEVSSSTNEQQTISISINAVQDDGNGGFTPTPTSFTGTIYRYNDVAAFTGQNINLGEYTTYQYANDLGDGVGFFDTLEACIAQNGEGGYGYSCRKVTYVSNGVGEYTTNPNTLNKNFYLKHDVVNDIIRGSYVCFITDKEYCIKSGLTGNEEMPWETYLSDNVEVFRENEEWFINNGGTCDFSGTSPGCIGTNDFSRISAWSDGTVYVEAGDSQTCKVNYAGESKCGNNF